MCATSPVAVAGGGPFGIDHRWSYDDSGIWARGNQNALIALMIAGDIGGALWEGGETRLGRTFWVSLDATAAGSISEIVLKRVFARVRPADTNDPNEWFKGHGNSSFPSGEVTVTSAIVTPFVLEYGREYPAAYALELLPVYDAIARVKVRGHWPSDVIAGFALGSAWGYWCHRRKSTPLVLGWMPHGIYVGLKKQW